MAALAAQVGLRYVAPGERGIARRRSGRRFTYHAASGSRVTAAATLARISALAIPPAWRQVWICATDDGHVQATGRDARGRKQYRYHAAFRAASEAGKFERLLGFAQALSTLRSEVARQLRRKGLPRRKVLAAVVALLDRTAMRIGNEEYAQQNRSYGLTTLRERHVEVRGPTLRITYRGKAGRRWEITLDDRRLAGIVRGCLQLPGPTVFAWVDAAGQPQQVTSADVNAFLREVAGAPIGSKDFRTWAATVAATLALEADGPQEGVTRRRASVQRAVEAAAAVLGNTPAVCRRSYVHPAVIAAALEGRLHAPLARARAAAARARTAGLDVHERTVLRFLRAEARRRT